MPSRKKEIPISAKWLLHVPKGYMDFTCPKNVFPEPDGVKHLISCRVDSARAFGVNGAQLLDRKKAVRLALILKDDRGNTAKTMIFNGLWPWRNVVEGSRIVVYAQTSYWNDCLQLDQPILVPECDVGRVHPQYAPLRKGTSGSDVIAGDDIASAVERDFFLLDEASQIVLEALRADDVEFCSIFGAKPQDIIRSLHRPTSLSAAKESITVVNNVAAEIMIRRAESNMIVHPDKRSIILIAKNEIDRLIAAVPFPLTGDQKRSIDEIINDMQSDRPMQRMLSGDVGTGKSLTFMIPAAAATMAKKKCAIITPNQLLVKQLAREMMQLFPWVPIQVITPGGKIKEDGGLVIGTTSVIFASARDNVKFDFVITDEEHKFSVEQKHSVVSSYTNFLKATATPIPRSMALVACDGMSLSILEECPVKKQVQSFLIGSEKKNDLLNFIRKTVDKGQAAIVYPAVMESEKVKSIEENINKWEKLFPGRVAALHGQMPAKSKQAALDAMLDGSKDILVASTAVEIGVTLPDLKLMVVVNPEMFGASQLHQLRGRVARHGGEGFFVMYCPDANLSQESLSRLNLVKQIENGFQLAEKDMEARGFGDIGVEGISQTGEGKIVFHNLNVSMNKILAAMSSRKGQSF